MFTIVPVPTSADACTSRRPAFEVEVYAPVALIEQIPFVATAPAVLVVIRKRLPDVIPVVETNERRIPVVAAPAVRSTIPVPVYAPVVVTVKPFPATAAT